MYYKGNTEIDLNKYFNEYLNEIVTKGDFGKKGDESKVSLIEGEEWYPDGVIEY